MTRFRFKRILAVFLVLSIVAVIAALVGYNYLKQGLPTIRNLNDYNPPQSTDIYSNDGFLLTRLGDEKRRAVDVAKLPVHVKQAFIAAEDGNFYEHEGLDYFGIARAMIKNLRPGAHLQGASTITQQTVKTLVVGDERSYTRKIREAVLAFQLEDMLEKDEILHLYLNQVFYGHGAYGIELAAQTYFAKSAQDLNVDEAAYVACALKNPSRYNLISNPKALKQRQTYVLNRMAELGFISKDTAEQGIKRAVPAPHGQEPYVGKAPHYVEHVRRLLLERFGERAVYEGGMRVYTAVNAKAQAAAHRYVQKGLEAVDGRFGFKKAVESAEKLDVLLPLLRETMNARFVREASYFNPRYSEENSVWHLTPRDRNVAGPKHKPFVQIQAMNGDEVYRGIVISISTSGDSALIDLGTLKAKVLLKSHQWAGRYKGGGGRSTLSSLSTLLRVGDFVRVRLPLDFDPQKIRGNLTKPPEVLVQLVPEAGVDGALVAIDPQSRYVVSMVGGYDPKPGGLLRSTQSKRQPGSTFKPLVYAAAIQDRVITPASLCPDSPVVIHDPYTGKSWKPQNYEDNKFDGNITFRTGLSKSKNTCSIKLLDRVKPDRAAEVAHILGIESKLPSNLTLALGTGEVTPIELANAYATLASGGMYAEPLFVRKVVRDDEVIFEQSRTLKRVFPEDAAYVVTHMMTSVVERGTAVRAKVLGRPLAGKTGTTNQSRSVWFAGFSPQLVATVYVGFDDNRPMARTTGSSAALPIWVRYMGVAHAGLGVRDFIKPEGVEVHPIDVMTGLASTAESAFEEVFLIGTGPDVAPSIEPDLYLIDEP